MLYVLTPRKFTDDAHCRHNEDRNDNSDACESDEIPSGTQNPAAGPSLASHHECRTIRVPARYLVNHTKLLREGGRNPIMLLLQGEIGEIQVNLERKSTSIPVSNKPSLSLKPLC
jgi:hypothetical protein